MIVTARSLTKYQVQIKVGQHEFVADEPLHVGDDAGPDPYGLLLSSLAACTIMTVQMYARRKDWPLDGVEMSLNTHKIHAKDCKHCRSDPTAKVDLIEGQIRFDGDLSDDQIKRLGEIADKCPVHRTLTSETIIRTEVEQPG
jgi:putative redox protein